MSRKDRDRLKVLHEVRKRHITQNQAGKESAISTNFSTISTTLGSLTFGQVTNTRDPRILQLALKLTF